MVCLNLLCNEKTKNKKHIKYSVPQMVTVLMIMVTKSVADPETCGVGARNIFTHSGEAQAPRAPPLDPPLQVVNEKNEKCVIAQWNIKACRERVGKQKRSGVPII